MKQHPNRKHPRLKQYDYRLPGYYYVTIHAAENAPAFSNIAAATVPIAASVVLTPLGRILERQLLALEQRYATVKIDKYVIMPNHIHVILRLLESCNHEMPPSLMDVVGTYKSLSTRFCNEFSGTPGRKLFQASFYETVLRNETVYQQCWLYIDGNPGKWLEGIVDD